MKIFKDLGKRIKDNFNKNKVVFFVLTILWIVCAVYGINKYKASYGYESIGNATSDEVVEVTDSTMVESILPVEDKTESISIKFATYARKNKGNVYIKVVGNNSGYVYCEETLNANSVKDNSFVALKLNKQLNISNDETITLTIQSDCTKDKTIGVYKSNTIYYEDSILKVNDSELYGDLTVKFSIVNEPLMNLCNKIICWSIIGYSLLILILLLIEPKPEILFTIITIVFGLVFMILVNPLSVPDEGTHYESAFQISNYMMFEEHDKINETYVNYSHFTDHDNSAVYYQRLADKFDEPLELEDDYKQIEEGYDIDGRYKIYYIPQAIGITIARLFNCNMLKTFYSGRLFNLLFYAFCIYISIKKTPIHKTLFGLIATCPMFIQQASSYSYDCFVNGLCLILISFLLKLMFSEEKISKKEYLFVFITELILAPAKVIYGLYILLYAFVPVDRFYSKKHKIICLLLLLLPTLIYFGDYLYWMFIRTFVKWFKKLFEVQAETYTGGYIDLWECWTIKYALNNIPKLINIFYTSIRYNIKKWFYDAIGYSLSGQTMILPLQYLHIWVCVLIATALRKEKHTESVAFKCVSLGICVVIAMMSLFVMLISWTYKDDPIIRGVQGRYFSPLLFYCFIIFNNKKFNLPIKIDKYATYIHILLTFLSFAYCLSYTFIN